MLAVLFAQADERARERLVAIANFEHGGRVLALKRLERGRRRALFSLEDLPGEIFGLDRHRFAPRLGGVVHGSELRDERLFPIQRLRHLRQNASVVSLNPRPVVILHRGYARGGHSREKRGGGLRSISDTRNGIFSIFVAISDRRSRGSGRRRDG